jgi:hypothetical protein
MDSSEVYSSPTVRFSLPTKKQVLRGALEVLGILLLGALGNGVWQSLLGPALHTSARWVLDIASLGLTSYKNGVYQQIAADNQPAVAVATLIIVTCLFGVIMVQINLYQYGRNDKTRSRSERLLRKLSDTPPNPDPAITVDTLRQEVAAILKFGERARLLLHVSSLILGVVLVLQIVSLARTIYVNSADAHYHHVLRVASPYLDAHEHAEVESDFAQIGSREDYVRLLSRLEGQCKAHGRTVPEFDAW